MTLTRFRFQNNRRTGGKDESVLSFFLFSHRPSTCRSAEGNSPRLALFAPSVSRSDSYAFGAARGTRACQCFFLRSSSFLSLPSSFRRSSSLSLSPSLFLSPSLVTCRFRNAARRLFPIHTSSLRGFRIAPITFTIRLIAGSL